MAPRKKQNIEHEQPIDIGSLRADAEVAKQNQAARFDLQDLVDKGEELERLMAEAEHIMAKLNQKNEEIRMLETETIPDMMKALNLKDLTLMSGSSIALVDVISTSITEDNRIEAHTWLREHGHGDIIKNNVTLSFGRDEDEIARKLTLRLLQMRQEGETKFGDIVQKEKVEPQTLKAFVKRRLEAGEEFPTDLFKLYTGQTVKFKKEK